jgi:hypothetical protein
MPQRNPHSDNWEFGGAAPRDESPQPRARSAKRRAATTLTFTALFFSGAALTAVAGDKLSQLSAEDAASMQATTTDESIAAAPAPDASAPALGPKPAPTEPAPDAAPAPDAEPVPDAAPAADPAPSTDSAPAEPASTGDGGLPGSDTAAGSDPAPEAAPAANPAPAADAAPAPAPSPSPSHPRTRARRTTPTKVVLLPVVKRAPTPEIEGSPAGATVWLNSPLTDPTPPAKRLSPAFSRRLAATAQGAGLDWALLLGVLRAKGATGRSPADAITLRKLANRLSDLHTDRSGWATALAYAGSASFADHALALARYDRAVGLKGLVHGLESVKNALGAKLLSDPQISIYSGGRADIVHGRVDVRLLATIAYLHEAYGEVTVSCLISGHRLFARPGHISAHIYGRAVDIAALGGASILGNSAPGGLTEHAVRDLLLLPPEVMPQQIISLLGLGGPSFPLANHYDHIHVGF